MRRAVFLDRDGVLIKPIIVNGRPHPPSNIKEVEILPGVKESLQRLHDAKYLLIVVTNQPDVARGVSKRVNVEKINAFIASKLQIDAIKTCYHDDSDACGCRKPKPGLLIEAANEYEINFSKSFMVGDRWRDIEAGSVVGCKTFFINYHYEEKQPEVSDFIVSSLSEVESIILKEFSYEKN